ncbi:MAG: NUDIX domain-containing protein [Agathobacter sp.]|nr:NUDIX domain-containing protein [Agathobacter sp.]
MQGKLRNMTGIYLLKGDKILLLYRQGGKVVNNVWTASAGGHFEKDELNDAKACVIRELKEELGVFLEDVEDLRLRYVALRNTKGEIRQNYYFFAELKDSVDENLHSNEGECKWFPLDEIAALEMPVTAKYVMEHYCKEGRFTDKVYVGVTYPDRIEMNELIES